MLTPQIPVAREGFPFIGYCALCTLICALFQNLPLTLLSLIVTSWTIYFFRDPERVIPDAEDVLLSPADGKVIIVERQRDSVFLDQDVVKVSIFMNVFNVHVNRLPVSGTIERVLYKPGRFYSADSSKAALENEYCATLINTGKARIACVQVAGLIARRIVCWLEKGDAAEKGKRYGLIRFGSRVDLYLPPDTDIQVKPGDKVIAGLSVLGTLK